jgi:cytoskeletal protein CcmA (bactofilin family)
VIENFAQEEKANETKLIQNPNEVINGNLSLNGNLNITGDIHGNIQTGTLKLNSKLSGGGLSLIFLQMAK